MTSSSSLQVAVGARPVLEDGLADELGDLVANIKRDAPLAVDIIV